MYQIRFLSQPLQFAGKFALLFLFSITLFSCQTYSAPREFSQVFAARYIPERVEVLETRKKVTERGPKIMITGAVSNADEFGRWGIVWAEYGKDYKGEWYRQRQVDKPVAYAETLDQARKESSKIIARYLGS